MIFNWEFVHNKEEIQARKQAHTDAKCSADTRKESFQSRLTLIGKRNRPTADHHKHWNSSGVIISFFQPIIYLKIVLFNASCRRVVSVFLPFRFQVSSHCLCFSFLSFFFHFNNLGLFEFYFQSWIAKSACLFLLFSSSQFSFPFPKISS